MQGDQRVGECSVVVKVTRLCNLRCSYCHDWRDGAGQTMTFGVLARVIAGVLGDPEHDAVSFIWHGGEPSMVGLQFFRRALVVQARFARSEQAVRNVLQTNGTRISAAWARFLRDYEFSVGISIDGPASLHDLRRVHRSGRGSFDEVLQGIRTLRDHGVPFGVLMVVDEAALELGPDAVFDFMLEHGISSYGFNAVCPDNQPHATPGTPAEPYVEPRAMGEFLAGIYDRWLTHGDRGIRIREIDGILARLRNDSASPCQLRGGCLGEYFIVEPDGDVAHCDLFLGDDSYRLGNVTTDTFSALRAGPAMTALRDQRRAELAAMAACPEFAVCNGWCPHETYLSRRHDPAHRPGCCGLDSLIGHIRATAPPPQRASVLLPDPLVRSGS
jgi:uncharacterized protein